MYKTLSAPISAHVELTSQCTNKCDHCYNYWRTTNTGTTQPACEWNVHNIINMINVLADNHVFNILFTGGEPTLVKKTLLTGLSHAVERGLEVALNSNLVPITPTYAKELSSAGLNSVLTSILGPSSEVHDAITGLNGSWGKALNNITIMQDNGINVSVNMVISQSNKLFIEQTVRLLHSRDVHSIYLTRASCPSNCSDFSKLELSPEDFTAYLEEANSLEQELSITLGALECYPLCGIGDLNKYRSFLGRRCLAGISSITVGSNGQVRACSHTETEYGHILDENLSVIWGRMDKWRDGSMVPPICKECSLFARCGGGCRMDAKMKYGHFNSLDPHANPSNINLCLKSLEKLPQNQPLPTELPEIFRAHSKLRIREENFGSIVLIGRRVAAYLNKDATKLVKHIHNGKTFTKLHLVKAGFPEDELSRFLPILLIKKILNGGVDNAIWS